MAWLESIRALIDARFFRTPKFAPRNKPCFVDCELDVYRQKNREKRRVIA